MRITGGKARGIPIQCPKGDATRPATDALREAAFSSLGELVAGSTVVDLFAGTGSYGLEALSRGATEAIFVENNRKCISYLESNIKAVCKSIADSTLKTQVIQQDVLAYIKRAQLSPSRLLIFADPPYEILNEVAEDLFSNVLEILKNTPNGRFIIEAPGSFEPKLHTDIELVRRLGKSKRQQPNLLIFKLKDA